MIRLYRGYIGIINLEYKELISHIFQASSRFEKIKNSNPHYRLKKDKEEAKEDRKFLRLHIKLLQEEARFLDEERNKMYKKYKELKARDIELNK